jgi:hypothetical protein
MNDGTKFKSIAGDQLERRGANTFDAVLNRLSDIIHGTMAVDQTRKSIRSYATFHARFQGLRRSADGSRDLPATGNKHRQRLDGRAHLLTPRSRTLRTADFSVRRSEAIGGPFSITSDARNSAATAGRYRVSDIESGRMLFATIRSESRRKALALQGMLSAPNAHNMKEITNLLRRPPNHSTAVRSDAVDHSESASIPAAHLTRRFAENERPSRSTFSHNRTALPFPDMRRHSFTNPWSTLGALTNKAPTSLGPNNGAAGRINYGRSPLAFVRAPVGVPRHWTDSAPKGRNEPSWNGLGIKMRLSQFARTNPTYLANAKGSASHAASPDHRTSEGHSVPTTAMNGQSPALTNARTPTGYPNSASNKVSAPLILNFSPTITITGDARADDLDNRILEAIEHYGRDIVRIVNRELQTQRRASF